MRFQPVGNSDRLNGGGTAGNKSAAFYNLDMIISPGYRVKSLIATQFRRWATERLKEYMIKGFTMDDERLKNRRRQLLA